MAYKPVDRSLPPEYLDEQKMVIRWMGEQGMRSEDIRVMRWGMMDMTTREVVIIKRIGPIRIEKKVRVRGLPVENYLMKSKILAAWMFVKERPRGWSREMAYNSPYDVDEIEQIVSLKRLTLNGRCDNMKVAKVANFEKLKPMEPKAMLGV